MKSIRFLFILLGSSCFAQTDFSTYQTKNIDINTLGSLIYNEANSKPEKGSPNLFLNWKGRFIIQTIAGKSLTIENLNYNLETKQLMSQFAVDTIFKFDLKKINYIINFNVKYKVINEELYEELSTVSQIVLYKGRSVKVIPEAKENDSRPKEYVKMEQYYCLINNTLKPIELKKRDVLECLAEREDQIKTYCKENKLSFSIEQDVIQMFNYYKRL